MTKKWDLETSNVEMELKIGIYTKNWVRQVLLKIFYYGQSQRSTVNNLVKVNGQRLTCADVAVWHHLRAYVAVHEAEQALGAHEARGRTWGLAREAHGRAWETLTARGAHAREAETSGSAWGHVWCSFWPFLVGFCLGLVVLSLYAFAFTIGWAERWYPRAVGTVGVMAMTRFCQWLLDEGDGSRRTPEMSIGIRKSEE